MNYDKEQYIQNFIPRINEITAMKQPLFSLREQFVNYFTVDKIRSMSIEEYALGNNHDIYNFSYALETVLKDLGSISGMSSEKFGVWYSPSKAKYSIARSYQDYGSVENAFEAVKRDILEVIEAGDNEDFATFTASRLNEYVKSKILSIYFPERYLCVFKKQTLNDLISFFNLRPVAEGTIYQREALIKMHDEHPIMKDWSLDVYSTFLWDCFLQLGGTVDKAYTNNPTPVPAKTSYWLYAPGENARLWDECLEESVMRFGWTTLGDYAQYNSREEIQKKLIDLRDGNSDQSQASLMVWNFLKEMKPGDVIYAKKGRGAIVGRGVVEGDYFYDASKAEYNACRKVKWTHNGEWPVSVTLALKTLTDLTYDSGMKKYLADLFNETPMAPVSTPVTPTVAEATPFSNDDFLNEVFISDAQLEEMQHILGRKKNIILQGAPGVGKTFCAKRLAYTMMGCKDEDRIAFVQFHQNYSYEDFIMGYKPNGEGFELKEGVFYRFCKKAQADPSRPYFFIIDEINRGNMSKIFGELLMLIEKDYRGTFVSMAYTDEPFTVPTNLYIIGIMNTADRSLAMIDYALRRRFSFVEMVPGFETDGFEMYQLELDNARFDALVDKLKQLNKAIVEDETLGSGFQIGHSYLCNIASDECNDSLLREIVTYDILPTLEEYWFDDKDKVENWRSQLLSIF